MAGQFFGGAFFGGGFFGGLPGAGSIGGGRQKKHRVVLPDGRVAWATRAELRGILNRLTQEFQDAQHQVVPIVRRQRKDEPDEVFTASAPADFPAVKPQVVLTKYIEAPGVDLDIEGMLRAYVEGQKVRQGDESEEEEWLMLFH